MIINALTVKVDVSLILLDEPSQERNGSRFTSTVMAQQREDLILVDVEGDPCNRLQFLEAFVEAVDLHRSFELPLILEHFMVDGRTRIGTERLVDWLCLIAQVDRLVEIEKFSFSFATNPKNEEWMLLRSIFIGHHLIEVQESQQEHSNIGNQHQVPPPLSEGILMRV